MVTAIGRSLFCLAMKSLEFWGVFENLKVVVVVLYVICKRICRVVLVRQQEGSRAWRFGVPKRGSKINVTQKATSYKVTSAQLCRSQFLDDRSVAKFIR
jgi:hypothetical protein